MATLLENLELEELSLVDVPANQAAMVSLFKRGNPDEKEEQVKKEDIKKEDVTPEVADTTEVDVLKAANEDLEKRLEALTKALDEAGFDVEGESISKRAPIEYIEVEGEQIAKSAIPAPILKALEAAEIAKADAELTKRAEEALPNFDVNVAKELVKAFSDEEKIFEALKAADAAFDAKMEELGETAAEELTTAQEKMDALCKEYAEEHNITPQAAIAKVGETAEGRELLKQIKSEKV